MQKFKFLFGIVFLQLCLGLPSSAQVPFEADTYGHVLSGKDVNAGFCTTPGEYCQEHFGILRIQWDNTKGGLANSVFQSYSKAEYTFAGPPPLNQIIVNQIPTIQITPGFDPVTGLIYIITVETYQIPYPPSSTLFTAALKGNDLPPVPFPGKGPNIGLWAETHGDSQGLTKLDKDITFAAVPRPPKIFEEVHAGPTPGIDGDYPRVVHDKVAVRSRHQYQVDDQPWTDIADMSFLGESDGSYSLTTFGLNNSISVAQINGQFLFSGVFSAVNPQVIPIVPGSTYRFRNFLDAQVIKEIAVVPAPLTVLGLPVILSSKRKLRKMSIMLRS